MTSPAAISVFQRSKAVRWSPSSSARLPATTVIHTMLMRKTAAENTEFAVFCLDYRQEFVLQALYYCREFWVGFFIPKSGITGFAMYTPSGVSNLPKTPSGAIQ